MLNSELIDQKMAQINSYRSLIDQSILELNQKLLLVISAQNSEITKLKFDLERLSKEKGKIDT
jgi:hypothetical protein